MKPVFIQLQCAPGRTYAVADAIYALEIASELYSTSGEYDLLMKIYVDASTHDDIGKFINEKISSIPGIVRSASLAIAISAPVLPADTAPPASPRFTASIASPIEVLFALRIAWLGLSSPVTTPSVWMISDAARRFG